MKFSLLLLCFGLTSGAFSQDSSIARTHFEQFGATPGAVLKTTSQVVGKTSGWSIAVFKITNQGTGAVAQAVNIDRSQNSIAPLVNTNTLYIDWADLDSVITVLKLFVTESNNPPAGPLLLQFVTAHDVTLTAEYVGNTFSWEFKIGRVYQHLRSPVANSFTTFNRKRMLELIALFEKAKTISF